MRGIKSLVFISLIFFINFSIADSKVISEEKIIRRVDNCVCYLSAEGQQLKPWELSWDDAEKLRVQFSHCTCTADIDMKEVKNPRRYIVPGTVVK